MSSAARSRCVVYLPIDGLIVSLEDALAEIAEIRSRLSSHAYDSATGKYLARDEWQALSECADATERALAFAIAYAKGPKA